MPGKKHFWPRLLRKKRKRKKRPKTGLVVSTGPKKHKTEPDHWTPPFGVKKATPPKADKRDLVIVNESKPLDLGNITATVGILLQAEMDDTFKIFINNCLERFSNLDWGGVNENEGQMNDRRVMTRTGTVYGIYTELRSGIQIWIATDLDHGVTRICLSNER